MRFLAAAVLVVAIGAIVAKLALSPFHDVYTTEQCRAAYAAAKTRVDSIAVSFKPFDDDDGAVDRRCSSVLPVREISATDLVR